MSEAIPKRDPVETARALERWLARRLGASSVSVSDLSVPKAGFSNETIIGRAAWVDGGSRHDFEFVLRIQPTNHQLFVAPDAARQARVMELLAGRVPVPRVWLTEPDPGVLGAPFFVMERIHGRIPGDVPSWHHRGWTTELTADERRLLHDRALRELVTLHGIDASGDDMAFLDGTGDGVPIAGSALEHRIADLIAFHDWCRPVLRYGVDVIEEAIAFVVAEAPADDRRSIAWGDARVGNMIFADDLSVAAMLDWEGATLGPPEIDVAWWVMFDEFLCEAQGLTRLPGVPDRAGTFDRYQQLAESELRDIGFYEVLACLQFALINSRLADLLIASGTVPERVASEFVTRVTGLMRRALDAFG